MACKLLQANLNHAHQAQDLFLHILVECDFGLRVAAEPYTIPAGHPCWMGGRTDTVTIT